jgi:hypothetical protein
VSHKYFVNKILYKKSLFFLFSFKTVNQSGIRKFKFEKEVLLFKYLEKLENINEEKSEIYHGELNKNDQTQYLIIRLNNIIISFIILAFGYSISFKVFMIELKLNNTQ